jgi:hypothetical protein
MPAREEDLFPHRKSLWKRNRELRIAGSTVHADEDTTKRYFERVGILIQRVAFSNR